MKPLSEDKSWEQDGWNIPLLEALDCWSIGDCKELPESSLSLVKHALREIERLQRCIKSIRDASMFPTDEFQKAVHDLCNKALNGGSDD